MRPEQKEARRRVLRALPRSPYIVRQVDANEYADDLDRLQDETGLFRHGVHDAQWWIAFFCGHPVAYLGLMPSVVAGAAYLVRVGVLTKHRGNGLQLRMMRVAERWARFQGYAEIISDTTENPPSANNFVKAGYHTYAPDYPWAFQTTIYWRKKLA